MAARDAMPHFMILLSPCAMWAQHLAATELRPEAASAKPKKLKNDWSWLEFS
jgi:hypothetical protein